jgi:hypothetical protein
MSAYTRVMCRCGKGKVSAYDGKCAHCRTKEEQKTYHRMRELTATAEEHLK